MRINKERVVQQFYDLIAIPCPSTQERQVADYLIREMEALGGTVTEDNAAAALQGTTGARAVRPGGAGCTRAGTPGRCAGAEPWPCRLTVVRFAVIRADSRTFFCF